MVWIEEKMKLLGCTKNPNYKVGPNFITIAIFSEVLFGSVSNTAHSERFRKSSIRKGVFKDT